MIWHATNSLIFGDPSRKERRRVAVYEMHITANGFVEELEYAMARMLARHGVEGIGKVLDEGEDHDILLSAFLPIDQPSGVSSSATKYK
jgi:hypothetical protein